MNFDLRTKQRLSGQISSMTPAVFEEFYIPEPNSGCWLWSRNASSTGYGRLYGRDHAGRVTNHSAHRISYEMHCGPIPEGMVVCHRCDVTLCVNPRHLFVGTQRENVRDCITKGRKRQQPLWAAGEDNPKAKVTSDTVRSIRAARVAGKSFVSIAAEFGIDRTTVSLIVRRKTWGHVE